MRGKEGPDRNPSRLEIARQSSVNAEICKQRAVFHANSAKQGLILEVNAWKSIIMSLLALRILGEGQLQFESLESSAAMGSLKQDLHLAAF